MVATAAAAAAAAAVTGDDTSAAEEAPSVTARLDLLLEKRRNALLGPSKISTAESRGEREYQASRLGSSVLLALVVLSMGFACRTCSGLMDLRVSYT